ncbi:sensor histidine kinase [Paenibacillus sp. CN-4]|uniref:cache domain-containing sensor histidine kinase n=1 Tax=Paenibacillus nanchangensis TaxID=3348343 RepID=UPI00397B66CF
MFRGIQFKSIFMKFSASFILVGLIPLFALSFFSVNTFSEYVERYTTRNMQQMVLYMSYNLNVAFDQYNETSKLMYTGRYDGWVESSRQNQTYNVNVLETINTTPIESYLKTLLFSDSHITSVHFVRKSDGKLYYQEKGNKALDEERLPYRDWLAAMAPQPSKVAIFPTHDDEYYYGSSRKVFTIGRSLIDTSGRVTREPKVVGTLFLDVDVEVFRQMIQELSLGDKDELYLLDKDGSVYFSNQEQPAVHDVSLLASEDPERIVIREPIPFLNGELIARIHRDSLFERLFSARMTVYLAIIICAFVLIVMGVWFSRRLARPIRDVIRQMSVVESGNLETKLDVSSNDELGRLAYGFNRMVERLQAYIDEAYVAQIKQKQTELNALKSQIRPHYLYNTLEVIRMNAVDKGESEVADMILSLSNQLKYVIDYGEDKVSIRSELEHLQHYFRIISVRYENRFDLHLDIGPGVNLDWPIVKLSLQPIVENAIQHGLRPKGRGTVGVTMENKNGQLHVTVYDDGTGMDRTRLSQVNEKLHAEQVPGKSIGLKNVNERIRTLFGPDYGLSISSREHIGTSVLLLFPVPDGEQPAPEAEADSSGRQDTQDASGY